MGKKQHGKDRRMFITKTEWATEWGGAKSKETGTRFKRIQFYCSAQAIKELSFKTKNWKELLTDEPFTKQDLITIQLVTPAEELKKMESDPSYSININGDIKQMLEELETEKAKEIALHGGGGTKAKNERAVALAAILAARSHSKDNADSKNAELPKQKYGIVDAASAAVHGRSAAAAKSDAGDKTAARIAMHTAGERTPINAKLVSFSF